MGDVRAEYSADPARVAARVAARVDEAACAYSVAKRTYGEIGYSQGVGKKLSILWQTRIASLK